MKKHEWKVREIQLVPDPEHSGFQFLSGLLVNTDRRRKVKRFAVSLAMGEFTLGGLADMLKDGQRNVEISDGLRPKRNKGPIVDPRQMELFKGGFDESDKTAVDEIVWKTAIHGEGS